MITQNLHTLLTEHVTLDIEGIDRMYLNVYQPLLQTGGGVCHFFKYHRDKPVASTALMAPMTEKFINDINSYAGREGIDLVRFKKGRRKDEETQDRLRHWSDDKEGVLYVGVAQEKFSAFRMTKRHNMETGESYPWLMRSQVMCNQYFFYIFGENFGPLFIKYGSYFPYTCRVNLNGHEYAKRQLAKEGIDYEELDNGVLSCDDPQRLQQILDELDEGKIQEVIDNWMSRLPSPFSDEDRAAGYHYRVSILQAEFARTQVYDKPLSGRYVFEQMMRENLDLGRADRLSLIFDRRVTRRTPRNLSTRVVTRGVTPSLHVSYKNSKIKQYFKLDRALRTVTTINHHTLDFYIGKLLKNLPALRKVGFQANRRLLEVEKISHNCHIGAQTFDRISKPQVVDGQRASALVFGSHRAMTLFSVLCMFMWMPGGFRNAAIREKVAEMLGVSEKEYSPGAMTYDLRRLRLHGVIKKIPRTHRYELTRDGARICYFMTKVHRRIMVDGLSQMMDSEQPLQPKSLVHATRQLDKAVDELVADAKLCA